MNKRDEGHDLTIGWREWVGLPELGLHRVKAKVDTGARTSALHAFKVEPVIEDGVDRVRFLVHPRQNNLSVVAECVADVKDVRQVRDSGGHVEDRYVIVTNIELGRSAWPIEMTLTSRDDMRFRMLLGRTALEERYMVDVSQSYLLGKRKRRTRS